MPSAVVEAIRTRDIRKVRAALAKEPAETLKPATINAAAANVFIPALELLVERGADINGVWRAYRPLQNLIQSDPHDGAIVSTPERLECLHWLLRHGADPELEGAWPPARAVIVAAAGGLQEFVDVLLRKDDDFAAASLGNVKRITAVLKKNPAFAQQRDVGGLSALQCAACSRIPGKQVEVARLLLDAGADLNLRTKSWTHHVDAVYLAANAKREDLFAFFLDRGADPTAAITPALWNGTEPMADLAYARGAVLDRAVADGQPLLNHFIRWGSLRQARWMLERGASPNIADAKGWTALHQAASRGNVNIIRDLLAAGANPSLKDHEGCLPRDRTTLEPVAALLKP